MWSLEKLRLSEWLAAGKERGAAKSQQIPEKRGNLRGSHTQNSRRHVGASKPSLLVCTPYCQALRTYIPTMHTIHIYVRIWCAEDICVGDPCCAAGAPTARPRPSRALLPQAFPGQRRTLGRSRFWNCGDKSSAVPFRHDALGCQPIHFTSKQSWTRLGQTSKHSHPWDRNLGNETEMFDRSSCLASDGADETLEVADRDRWGKSRVPSLGSASWIVSRTPGDKYNPANCYQWSIEPHHNLMPATWPYTLMRRTLDTAPCRVNANYHSRAPAMIAMHIMHMDSSVISPLMEISSSTGCQLAEAGRCPARKTTGKIHRSRTAAAHEVVAGLICAP